MGNGQVTAPARFRRSRVDVLGVAVDALDQPVAVRRIEGWIERGEANYVCVTGVHGVMEACSDRTIRDVHTRAGLVVPDGMPLVWAGHYAGARWMGRVYGPDLMLAVLARSIEPGWRHFFYGGREGVPELLAERLTARMPGLNVVGTYSPPFRPLTDAEDEAVVERIRACEPHVVWVGISTPKQERWMAGHVERLGAAVLVGVGAAFDFHAGLQPQAPRWLQRSGMEWAYRMAHEPRRLARRYLRNNPRFVGRILRTPPVLQVPLDAPAPGEPAIILP
jgi:N-acetylglucosaminyldiphosphoundecaprenol N-acetyl-beta-D-mannosaminyltransferase